MEFSSTVADSVAYKLSIFQVGGEGHLLLSIAATERAVCSILLARHAIKCNGEE